VPDVAAADAGCRHNDGPVARVREAFRLFRCILGLDFPTSPVRYAVFAEEAFGQCEAGYGLANGIDLLFGDVAEGICQRHMWVECYIWSDA
jgi:hypothetical protein